MDATTDLNARDLRWLSPLALWTGILAGPFAWALDQMTSYALVQWACHHRAVPMLRLISPFSLALVAGGAMVSWLALRHSHDGEPTDGGKPLQRARFMAIVGLSGSALFALAIVALAIPRWVVDVCH